MELVSYIQAVLTLTLVALTILVLAAVRSVQRAVRDLVSMLRKGQREPEPAPPRAALPESPARSEGVPVVPAEPVPSSAVSEPLPASTSKRRPPPHAPPIKVGVPASGVAPPTAMPRSTDRDERPWSPPYRPTVEDQVAARAAHAASLSGADEVEGDERSTVEIPAVQIPTAREVRTAPPNVARALGATGTMLGLGVEAEEPSGDRPTDESATRVWSTEPASGSLGGPEPEAQPEPTLEADLSEETLARVDALARERGVSRARMLWILAQQGTTAEEKRKADLDKGKG